MRPDAHTLVAAYAADALDESENADVRQHLTQCEVCRDDVRAYRETLAVLAVAAGEVPPARLRERVLLRVRRTPQLPPLPVRADDDADAQATAVAPAPEAASAAATSDEPSSLSATRSTGGGDRAGTRRSGTTRLFALAASTLTVVALAAGAWGLSSADRLSDVRAEQDSVQRVLAAGDVATVTATPQLADGVQGDDVVLLASASADAALLLPAGLPTAPEGSTWQVWALTGDEATPDRLFDGAGGEPVALQGGIAGVDAIAVTLEPAGGSPAPTSDPVLVVPLV